MIIEASNTWMRERVFEYARGLPPSARILDVGGASGAWSIATHVVDIQPGQAFVGDIGRAQVWDQVRALSPHWDLVVCTHTLEDIRDPGYVLEQINSLALAVFIAVPHKHSELGVIDSDAYVGYCHHRWVFTFQEPKLRILAKWPVTARLAPGRNPGPDFLPWLDRDRNQYPNKPLSEELGVFSQGPLDWEYINADFAGMPEQGCMGMLQMYRDELAGGL